MNDLEKIYSQIAKDNGVSVETVKNEMQKAINAAFAPKKKKAGIISNMPIPTIDEFLLSTAKAAKHLLK